MKTVTQSEYEQLLDAVRARIPELREDYARDFSPEHRIRYHGEHSLLDIEVPGDGSHCGITDLYQDLRLILEEVLKSGLPFSVNWASKKEILTAGIDFDGEVITVGLTESMDEGFDLIDDAVWSLAKEEDYRDTGPYLKDKGVKNIEAFMQAVHDEADELGLGIGEPSSEDSKNIPYTTDLDEVLKVFDDLDTRTKLDETSESLKALVKQHLDDLKSEAK